jgi:hypothetical protein
MIRKTALALALMSLAACGPSVSLRVSRQDVQELPVEERLDLLDAENDLFVAIDKRDDASQAVDDAKVAYRQSARRLSASVADLDRAERAGNPQDMALAKIAVQEARLGRRYQSLASDLAAGNLEAMDAELLVARARFEKAKAEAVRRAKVKGSSEIVVAKFSDQLTRLERYAAKSEKSLQAIQAKADAARNAWLAVGQKLSDLTGGAKGSPWVQ